MVAYPWGAHASPRAISGVPPEDSARRDAEQHTRDAYAPLFTT